VGLGAEGIKGLDHNGLFPATPFYVYPKGYHRLAEINPGQGTRTLALNLTVDRGRTVAGEVRGPDGKALAGALAFGLRFNDHGPYWEYEPQETPAFTVYGIRKGETRKVVFLHYGRRLAASLALSGDEKSPLAVKLRPWGTVMGRLVDAAGRPQAGVPLTFPSGAITSPDQGTHPEGFRTDKDGKFRIEGLVPGMKYTLGTVDGSGAVAGVVFRDLTVKSGEAKDLGDVRFGAEGGAGKAGR
jgi:hypothetical protein